MGEIMAAVSTEIADMLVLGRWLLAAFFSLAVLFTYIGLFQNKNGFSRLILSLVIGFVMLQSYVWMMEHTRQIIDGVSYRINGTENYLEEYLNMGALVQEAHEGKVEGGLISKTMDAVANFGKETIHNFVVSSSFIFFSIVTKIMSSIRGCLVGILYLLGPILIPFILFDTTRKILRGWFTSYVGCLSWPILWNLTLKLAVAYAQKFSIEEGAVPLDSLEPFVALNFAVGFVVVFSPMIVTSLAHGVGAGAAASLAGAFATNNAVNVVSKGFGVAGRTMQGAASGFSYGVGKAAKSMQSASPVKTIASIGGSAIKDTARGAWRGFRAKDYTGYRSSDYSIKRAIRPK